MHIWFIVLSNIHCNLTCDTFFNKRNYIHSHTSYERTSKQTKPQSHMTRYKKKKKKKKKKKQTKDHRTFIYSLSHTHTLIRNIIHSDSHQHIHTHTHAHTHTYIHLQTYTRIHTYSYKLTHAYIHTVTN